MLQTIVGGVLLIIAQLLTAVVMVLRFMPQLTNLIIFVLRAVLTASALLYRSIIMRAGPMTARMGFDIATGWRRAVVCVVLSLVFGVFALFMLQWVITPFAIGVCIMHGLVVHFAWDQLAWPTGIHIGL